MSGTVLQIIPKMDLKWFLILRGGFQGWAEGDEAIAGKWANVPTTPVSEFSRSAYEFQPKMIP